MKSHLIATVITLSLVMSCDAQQSEIERVLLKERDRSHEIEQRRELERRQAEYAAERERSVAGLRAALSTRWSYATVALRYDCSCTGTSYSGFRVSREGNSIAVVPWTDTPGWSRTESAERTGPSRPLAMPDLERLLSETALFYLSATLSVAPLEKVGPRPTDTTKQLAWRAEYLAAGGSPEASDHLWIDIRVGAPDGEKHFADMWERHCPADFSTWINAFGTVPRR